MSLKKILAPFDRYYSYIEAVENPFNERVGFDTKIKIKRLINEKYPNTIDYLNVREIIVDGNKFIDRTGDGDMYENFRIRVSLPREFLTRFNEEYPEALI